MKIVNKEVESIRFDHVKPGDVFVSGKGPDCGLVCMKLDVERLAGDYSNAVHLSDGCLGSFQNDAQVYPVNYELHIVV